MLFRSSITEALIQMASGTYNYDLPITLCSGVTLEGGFDATFTTKSSLPGATTIYRSNLNPDGRDRKSVV